MLDKWSISSMKVWCDVNLAIKKSSLSNTQNSKNVIEICKCNYSLILVQFFKKNYESSDNKMK